MKDCPSYPGYSITENGEVYTHRKRFGLGQNQGGGVKIDLNYSRKMNPYKAHGGYMYVAISTNGKMRSIPIHILLLDAYVSPRPFDAEVRHLDGNPNNNDLSNLSYGTVKQNSEDKTTLIRKQTLTRILQTLKREFEDVWNECI